MTLMQVIFLVNGLVTIFAALMMVTSRKLIHASLWLVLCLFGVAAVFGLLEASFITIVQIIVYIGAIAILIVFAVMLTQNAVDDSYKGNRRWLLTGLVALLALGGTLLALLTWPKVSSLSTTLSAAQLDIGLIGQVLVDPQGYVIPFEVSSLLLIAALIGAIYVGMEHIGEEK